MNFGQTFATEFEFFEHGIISPLQNLNPPAWDPQEIIEHYQKALIQIATPPAPAPGFMKEFDLIVTNEHVVGPNAEVTIAGKTFRKAFSPSGIPTGTWPFCSPGNR